jgi:hypothetical protein
MMAKKIPKNRLDLDVVGLQYRVTLSTLHKLSTHCPIPVVLEREPDNFHDENAIKVSIAKDADAFAGMELGYVRRQTAAVLSLAWDAGKLKLHEAQLTKINAVEGTGRMWVRFTGSKKLLEID